MSRSPLKPSTAPPSLAQRLRRPPILAAQVVALAALAVLLPPGDATAQDAGAPTITAERLIAENVEARGGRQRLEAIEAVRLQGSLDLAGSAAPFSLEWRAPNRVRMEMAMEGMKLVQAFDGEVAWRITPFTGPEPQVLSGEEAAALRRTASDAVRGPLFDPGRRGWKVEYVGPEEIDSRATHKLRLTRNDHKVLLWLDAETFLETRLEEEVPQPGGTVKVVTRPGNFRAVDGIRFPFSVVQQMEGAPDAQRFEIESIEVGAEIDDSRFSLESEGGAGPEGGG